VANYKILIKPSAIKELNKIPKKELPKIAEKIKLLSDDPRPPACEKLAAQNAYRIRQGSYRIIYTIEDDKLIIFVIKIGHRREVYR
jgi:mRNA interferase RelE/StbE